MRYTMFLPFILLAGVPAFGAQSMLSAPPPATAKLNEVVTFNVRPGYHFNAEAPQTCGDTEAFDMSSSSVKCQFSSGGTQEISLKFCEDGHGMCLFEDFTIEVEGGTEAASAEESARAAADPPLPGFVQNDVDKAVRMAKKEKKLVFLDMFTKWCPYCRLMEDTVLTHPAFLEASAGMVRVSVDGDTPQARRWLTKFDPPGYPTYLVADADLREIGRISGNVGVKAFAEWLRRQERWKDLPIADAKAGAASLDEDGRLRVAGAYMAEKKWDAALELLENAESPKAEYLAADCRLQASAASADKEGRADLYRMNIKRFDGSGGKPASPGVISWISELHELEPASAKPWLKDADALAARLIESPLAQEEGYSAEDVYMQLGGVLRGAGMKGRAKKMFLKAADGYAALAAKAGKPEAAKGLRMFQAGALAAAGRYKDSAGVYSGLVRDFPEEYAFHRSLSSMRFRLKQYPEALNEASLAASLAYGDIRLDILYMKARIEAQMKDRAAALKTLDDALASIGLPGDPRLKTHRLYAKLKNYRGEVEALK